MNDDNNFRHGTQARVIEDSISEDGNRLTTLEVVFHRFVLAEFNTHRLFSRNSASSRAIPFRKQVNRVLEHPAVPVAWPAEQRGMVGGDEIDNAAWAEQEWLAARDKAVASAERLAKLGVHKSVVNRLLEPFMWHTVIVTATDWDGFWHQRCHAHAQPEIHVAADAMLEAYNNSTPRLLVAGQWHMPYIEDEDYDAVFAYRGDADLGGAAGLLRQVSAARCARVSYLTHDGVRSIEKDLELYRRLVERAGGENPDPIHYSPLEHVATPGRGDKGNFTGWDQLRHMVGGKYA
jgi:thymidylate synthase ThyX